MKEFLSNFHSGLVKHFGVGPFEMARQFFVPRALAPTTLCRLAGYGQETAHLFPSARHRATLKERDFTD